MTQALKKIPLKIWFFAFAVLFLFITIINLPAVGAEEAQSAVAEQAAEISVKYDHESMSLRGAVTAYHKRMNEIMNDFSEKLLSTVDLDPDKKAEITGPPTCDSEKGCSSAAEAEKYCTGHPENVSTFCLSVQMTYEYAGFLEALTGEGENSHKKFTQDKIENKDSTIQNKVTKCEDKCKSKKLPDYVADCEENKTEALEKDCDGDESCEQSKSAWQSKDCQTESEDKCLSDCEDSVYTPILDSAIERLEDRQKLIAEQVTLAKEVMDRALAVYNQLQMYYELHVAYTGIIKDLESYRDELAGVRKEVEKYPDKFHNVTTTECT